MPDLTYASQRRKELLRYVIEDLTRNCVVDADRKISILRDRGRLHNFCGEYVHLYQNVIFDFDVSIFASDNLDDCMCDIGRNLFSQRTATFPYVQAFLMFGAYVNHQLKDKSLYKEDMLITALENVLDENGFRLPVIIQLSYIFK